MSTTNAGKLIEGKATDMNDLIRRRPPTAEAEAAAEAEVVADADPPAPPSFDGGARVPPATGTDMNAFIRRQIYGRG